MLNFYPTAGTTTAATANYKTDMHRYHLTTRTQCPGVQIDLNCETQVSLKIPFISSATFYPLRSKTLSSTSLNIGVIQLHPYIASNVNTTYSLYVHFEDIELIGTTVPQMGVQQDEQNKAGIGPVTTTLRNVTKSLSYMKDIPIVGPNISSLSWYSDLASKVSSVWGWSKPAILKPPIPMFRHRGFQNQNVDGGDVSALLSLSVKNEVSQEPSVFGTNYDEMSFDYIKSIPAYVDSFGWSVNDAKEILKYSKDLSPNVFLQATTDNGSGSILVFPPCVAPIFNFDKYRGSFTFTIKIVKTEFHSGRLALVYTPYSLANGLTVPLTTYNNSYYSNRTIIDIRYGTEWTFTFPYVSETLYKNNATPYGAFYIYIENPLVAPASVANNVTVLLEVSGAPDLEFAHPDTNTWMPYHPSAPQSGGQFECDKIVETIGSTQPPIASDFYSAIAMGEKFTSIRQLLKRMEFRSRSATASANYFNVLPYAMSVAENTGVNIVTAPGVMADSFTFYGMMYAMARGSIRIKFWDSKPNSAGSVLVYPVIYTVTSPLEFSTGAADKVGLSGPKSFNSSPVAAVPVSDGLTGEVTTPMYSRSFAYSTADAVIGGVGATKGYDPRNSAPATVICYTQSGTANTVSPYHLRGCGDDFSFGYFVSTVPVYNAVGNFPNAYT